MSKQLRKLILSLGACFLVTTAFAQSIGANGSASGLGGLLSAASPEQLQQIAQSKGINLDAMVQGMLGAGAEPTFDKDSATLLRQKKLLDRALKEPTEFERYASSLAGVNVIRFGSTINQEDQFTYNPSSTSAVPADYKVAVGDEIIVRIWGSFDLDNKFVVDRAGQISLPKIGVVSVGGVDVSRLNNVILATVSKTIAGANVAASIGRVNKSGVRIYVTGYAQSPGAYTVNSLSSLVNVLMAAGGPADSGSYRNIQLRRSGKIISQFDLYDLLLKGDKSQDRPVVAEDVIYVGPAGAQVAIIGAVNQPAIYEIKKNETLLDILAYAGGFVSGAQTDSINYMGLHSRREGFKALPQEVFSSKSAVDGDVYMATSGVGMLQPADKQMRMIKVNGQVNNPGIYVLKAGSTLQDAVNAAGGLSEGAYLYGTRLERITLRATQEENLKRFIREFKRDAEGAAAVKATSSEDASIGKSRYEQGQNILKGLRELKPEGRMALHIKPTATKLPNVLVESGDVLTIPMNSYSVTVLGSINGGQVGIAFGQNQSARDYIRMAGGYSRGADSDNVYVMRASGEFVSTTGWFRGPGSVEIMSGDSIFIPENLQKTSFTKEFKDWTQILYQFGLGVAAIKVLGN